MKFSTPVDVKHPGKKIEHHDKLMFLGSCFSDNIGAYFSQYKFQTCINPFGVIYNPVSDAECLSALIQERDVPEDMLTQDKGQWHSMLHHGRFSSFEKLDLLNNIEEQTKLGHDFLKDANVLFLTFGTSWVYEWKENGQIVSNCHKLPATAFSRYRLEVDEIVTLYKNLLVELRSLNPDLRIVFTVSPVRHFKDGAHENQLSKAVLHLAVDQLCRMFERCDYFPSYELILDELRDYRFFEADMMHVNRLGTDFIWEKLSEHCLSNEAIKRIKEIIQINKAVAHKPYNPTDSNYLDFIKSTIDKITTLQHSYAYVDMRQELKRLSEIMNSNED